MKTNLLFKMKLAIKQFLNRDYYYRLAPDDIMGKQRYKLFRTFSIAGAIISLMVGAQAYTDFHMTGILPASVVAMFPIYLLNYFLLSKHKNTKIAYIIVVISTLMVLHFVSYFSGGIRNSGMIYLGAVILCAFMLLGSKIGRIIGLLALANLAYFYYITLNTHLVTNLLVGEALDNDFLVSGLLGIFFIAAQSNYLESSKNIVIQSITDAHEQLREKAIELRKLSLVASKTDNGVIITDKNNMVEYVNDGFARLSGYTLDEVIGKDQNAILRGPLTDRETYNNLQNTLSNKAAFSGELLQYHKDGSTYWIQVNITPIVEDSGEVSKYIYIESNITERKEAEEKMAEYLQDLEKSNKELDQFAYVVSHDLKAPLRAIGNLSSWIEEDLGDALEGDVKSNFNIIKGRVERMENLINGILDYSRATRREGEESIVPVEHLLKDTLELLSPPDNFKVTVQEEMPIIYTEKTKLQQVFANLISNAFKHNDKPEGIININWQDAGEFYQFTIEDNGPGIEKLYHDKIFVIFQVLQARDQKESTGVGLAIVKKIIDELGAQIHVESEEGHGAKFVFTWPKKDPPAQDELIIQMPQSKAA